MLQRNGLLCGLAVIAILALLALTMPTTVFAQSYRAARINIQGDDAFGDILVVKDGVDVILYGLAFSVPSSSKITITAGGQTFERNASYLGKFPILPNKTIRITNVYDADGNVLIESATIKATSGGASITGTVSIDIQGDEVRQALADGTMPPHRLLFLVEANTESPTDMPTLGAVLLTQRIVKKEQGFVALDEFEGLSGAGTGEIRSVPPFSKIGVYAGDANLDVDAPDRTRLIQTISTEVFYEGRFVSNGSFFPFTIQNVNSFNVGERYKNLIFRIQEPGQATILAALQNDVSVDITDTSVVNNNTTPGAVEGEYIIANVSGQTDPYAVVSAYKEDSDTSDVLAQVTANLDGTFTIDIPGNYETLQTVYLGALDSFGNVSASLTPVDIDDQANFFGAITATVQTDRTYTITGVVEPGAHVLITGRNRDESASSYLEQVVANTSTGAFEINVSIAYDYIAETIDLAGNTDTSDAIAGDQSTLDPANLIAIAAPPTNIEISGTVEPNAVVEIFGLPLNQVPEAPASSADQPANAFFIVATAAATDGSFTLLVPAGISKIVYLRAIDESLNSSQFVPFLLVDAEGNLLSEAVVDFVNINFVNKAPGIPDLFQGQTVNYETGTPVGGIYVEAFLTIDMRQAGTPLFFGEQIAERERVDSLGNFELTIPDFSPETNVFIESFYVVASELRVADDGTLYYATLGFLDFGVLDGLDREGPDIIFAPLSSDIQLIESGELGNDILNILNIYPAGTGSDADIPDDAIPFVAIIADDVEDGEIDITATDIQVITIQPLNAVLFQDLGMSFLPMSGVTGINLGRNYWDPIARAVVGRSEVFIALMDDVGNFSPYPLLVELDVAVVRPDVDKITAQGDSIVGQVGSVEPNASVILYKNKNKTDLIDYTNANADGSFSFTGLAIDQPAVYLATRDVAGNDTIAVEVIVKQPVSSPSFLVMDGFGLLHTSETTLSSGLASSEARVLALADGNNSLFYKLLADGTIVKIGESGKAPLKSEEVNIPGEFARDLVVTGTDPFSGYMLLGNGLILTFGDAQFFGDIVQLEKGSIPTARKPLADSDVLFEDLNGNGIYENEDPDGNGVLDPFVVIGADGSTVVSYPDDLNGNGQLDLVEALVNPSQLGQGFRDDIARKLNVVKDSSGAVKGYVIMDGFGGLWAFGSDIGAEVLSPASGFSSQDIFRDFELIVDDSGKIVDYITLNGFGQIFGQPGGVLGAGSVSGDPNAVGHLTVAMNASTFTFDIARAIRINPLDTNEDGTNDWQDGIYVLDGFGGIHGIGGAPEITDSPFLGFDIARSLEFSATPLK